MPNRRLLIHPGFHKTGTTTLQETLRVNRPLLEPHVEVLVAGDMDLVQLSAATKAFSEARSRDTKDAVREEAELLFATLANDDPRPVLISHENLSGHFIGHKTVFRYAAAPIALGLMVDAWEAVTGARDGLEVYFSTRREGWLASCYWQRLKGDRFRMPYDVFCSRYADAADHAAIVAATRARLTDVPVSNCDKEDFDHPITPVLDLLGLGDLRRDMTIPEDRNTYPGGDARARLWALNRSDLRGKAYWEARRAIVHGPDGDERT
ncbi:hypothetical protein [Celeribacter arenosi]|uniref:Sulfotransferase family protein n=1 Tax=Celeribacter arenosi TaxID=792649 RepID=A0ABP7K5F5_9RHOB